MEFRSLFHAAFASFETEPRSKFASSAARFSWALAMLTKEIAAWTRTTWFEVVSNTTNAPVCCPLLEFEPRLMTPSLHVPYPAKGRSNLAAKYSTYGLLPQPTVLCAEPVTWSLAGMMETAEFVLPLMLPPALMIIVDVFEAG